MTPTHYLDITIHSDLRDGFGTQMVLAAIHSANRRAVAEPLSRGYPLGVAFPFWVDPKFHATRMIGFGSAGPIIRVVSAQQKFIEDLVNDTRLIQMRSIGEISTGNLIIIPKSITAWVAFCRASDGESLTPSQQRRLAKRLTERQTKGELPLPVKHVTQLAEVGYLKLPLQSASTQQAFYRPVRRITSNRSPIEAPVFDSWGFTKPGGTFPAF